MNAQSQGSFFARKLFHQELIGKAPRAVNDDIWTFNTQVSSQWDGLRHYAYQKEKKFYNGVTMDDIHNTHGNCSNPTVNGIQGEPLTNSPLPATSSPSLQCTQPGQSTASSAAASW